MASLSVCMIVRDEEPVMERCMGVVSQFADEIVVVDTGSSDRTKEIALRYTPLVYDYTWNDDFAAARNASYAKATCDYIMWMDADDDMEPPDIARLRSLKESSLSEADVVLLQYRGDVGDGTGVFNAVLRDRIVRNGLGARWVFPVHETMLLEGDWNLLYRDDIVIHHRKLVVNDARRNLRIFEKSLAAGVRLDGYGKSYYCRELAAHGRYREAADVFDEMLTEGACEDDVDYAMPFYIESMQQMDRYRDLKETLLLCRKSYRLSAAACCALGKCFLKERDDANAELWYRRALAVSGDLRDLRVHMGLYEKFLPLFQLSRIYSARGDAIEARRYFEKVRSLAPDSVRVKLLGLELERKGML